MASTIFTVGWICALTTEYVAARTFLDEEYEQPESVLPNDNNAYTLGRIGEHNVVIAVLPNGEYGISSAASVARDMMHSFPDIRIGMMVGIGGGAPSQKHDIRLGDVVVSVPGDGKGGVFQYDFGKTIQDQKFRSTGFLNQPPTSLLTAVTAIRGQYEIHGHKFEKNINLILQEHPRLQRKYSRPDPSTDRLYQSAVVHSVHGDSSCAIACGIDPSLLIARAERTQYEDDPAIHYGVIASANQLMKDALVRDRLSAEEGILCFEMEAAGLMNRFPCIVIRGICDYSDSHKNKEWQGYAAMTAAAYAKDLLHHIAPKRIETERKIGDILSGLHEVAGEQLKIAKEQLRIQKANMEQMLSKEEQECHQLFRLTTDSTDATYEWYKERVEERVEDTCLWFLRHEHFQKWLEQDSGPLLVTADPGCGKSVLAKYLIEHALPRSSTICYFFFKDQDQNTVRQALCALLHQLFSQKPPLVKHATAQLRRDGKGLINSTGSLWDILRNAVNDPQAGQVTIVLDALDECAESEFSDLVQNVERQVYNNKLSHGKLKYLLTSRPYEQIVSKFNRLLDDFPEIRIPGEEDSEIISQEVNRVITYRINQLSKRKRLSTGLKNHLEQRLRQTTHRTYLWVYLVFDYLEQENFKKTLKGIESTVVTLPNSINEAYEQILSKSKEDPMVRKVLSIILAASRPLTLSEMNIAINVDFDSQSVRDLDLEDDDDFKSRLRGWCGLFVSIHHGKIYFLHQTAREFLLADLARPTAAPVNLRWHHSISARKAHTVLAECCVLYLNLFNSDSRFTTDWENRAENFVKNDRYYNFLHYSSETWGFHFREASILDDDADIVHFAMKICDTGSKSYSAWSRFYWGRGLFTTTKTPERPENLTDLMVASYFGHPGIVKALLKSGAEINRTDAMGRTALSWAAEERSWVVFELLLVAGATLDFKYSVFREEAHGLSRGKGRYYHDDEGRPCLFDGTGADRFLGQRERTPLSRAAEKGYERAVKLLLETGKVDIDWRDQRSWTPLARAIEEGHCGIVRLLLQAGAKVNYQYDVPYEAYLKFESTTPLSRAAEKGNAVVAELLLETGKADIDWKDEKGWTALSWAVEGRFHDVVKLLLMAGATVQYHYNVCGMEAKKYQYHAYANYEVRIYRRTPLSRAAELGDSEMVKLLIETGKADVNCVDESGWTPLSWAVEEIRWAVAEQLVRAGANIHREYKVFENFAYHIYTPVSRAKEDGKEAVVKYFLEASHNHHNIISGTLNSSQSVEFTSPEDPAGTYTQDSIIAESDQNLKQFLAYRCAEPSSDRSHSEDAAETPELNSKNMHLEQSRPSCCCS